MSSVDLSRIRQKGDFLFADRPRAGALDLLRRAASTLFGGARETRLEQRLFNTISLLNGVTNICGALVLRQQGYLFLSLLHLGTGALFLLFYYLSRFRRAQRTLYWPFVLTIAGFLFVNIMRNAGSQGGAHYYLVPALVIATILSGRLRTTLAAILLFGGAGIILMFIEQRFPALVTPYADPRERLFDVGGNLLFVQIFTGLLVLVLTQNLNQERRKSDLLLRNVLPDAIAEELKARERVEPRAYAAASVLFTDFVGFTQITAGFTPQRVIEELDRCFRRFDEIARRHRLEKIKTIGDAYMAVGGVPAPNETHARDCVLAALEIRDYIAELRAQRLAAGEPYWGVRIGIHTGDLVAGVIGREKFTYDVWGDTVNTASRHESSGAPGRVNISASTYELVGELFECEPRGKIEAKGKGALEMYFVNRARS